MLPKVAIVYLSFHSEPYLDDMVAAFKKITYPKALVELVIVDNLHPTHGSSVAAIEQQVLPLSGTELPHVTLLPQDKNLGFPAGINVGIQWALDHGFDYVYLHNNDGFVAPNFLEPLVDAMEQDKKISIAQSLMLTYPDTKIINTSGNKYHYLGLGYSDDFNKPLNQVELPAIKKIVYASGAACLLRADLLKKYGLWDSDYFIYHEDIEYNYRLKALGYQAVMVKDSHFFHKYTFGRNPTKNYYIERNRIAFLVSFYKWRTLLLILPAYLFLELGLLALSLASGWLPSKLKAYRYWLKASNRRQWLAKRATIQKLRTVNDRELLADAVGTISDSYSFTNNPLVRYIANPLLGTYWQLVKLVLFW